MKFDDIIGILFLLFFILGPALKGLFKPGEPLIEVELPEAGAEPGSAQPVSNSRRMADSAHRPAATTSPSVFPPPEATKEHREATEAASVSEAKRAIQQEKLPDGGRRRVRKLGLRTGRRAILNGMLWHEILSEPVAVKRLKQRRRGAKLE